MIRASASMDDLTSDIRHLSTLIGTITSLAIDIIDPGKTSECYRKDIDDVSDLLWIARDMVEQLAENGEACHAAIASSTAKAVKAGGVDNG